MKQTNDPVLAVTEDSTTTSVHARILDKFYQSSTTTIKSTKFSPLYSIYVLFLVLTISVIGILYKLSYSIWLPYMKKQINITDTQIGLLTGIVHSIIYCVSGISFGKVAEFVPRKILIAASIFFAGIITTATGFSMNFWYLLVMKVLLAIATAAASSCAVSLLADFFPPQYRASAVAVFNWGSFTGMGVSYAVAGIANSDNASSPIWRYVMYGEGVPGVIAGIIMLITVKEPLKGRFDKLEEEVPSSEDHSEEKSGTESDNTSTEPVRQLKQHSSTLETIKFAAKRPTFYLLSIAAGCRIVAGLALAVWLPAFFIRTHSVNSKYLARWLSWIIPLGGACGIIFGGYYCDKWTKKDKRATSFIATISCALSIPFAVSALLIPNTIVAMLCMGPNMLVSEMWAGPAGAMLLEIFPSAMRTLSYAVYYFTLATIGGLGPFLVGLMNKKLPVRYSMLIIVVIFYIISGLLFLSTSFTLKSDIQAKLAWEQANATSNDNQHVSTTMNTELDEEEAELAASSL